MFMATKICSSALVGIEAVPVEVEADISPGLPNFVVVGLPDTAVQESKERVKAAFKNSGLVFPRTRVTVNLAPADIKKQGPSYDLPVATAILEAQGAVRRASEIGVFIGELALDGALRPVSGVLASAVMARERGFRALFVPRGNEAEAALVSGVEVYPVRSLAELVAHLKDEAVIERAICQRSRGEHSKGSGIDFSDIAGQNQAKRALEIAAAGGHNVLMSGPPGTGKTMLARALPTVLPELSEEESLEITRIKSAAGLTCVGGNLDYTRPFRSPHHTSSSVAIIGGGTWPRPGEVSLAHRGVLFLDELPEFGRSCLESLRQPLEDGFVTISRSAGSLRFPAQFMLIGARNPCPCGHYGDSDQPCVCLPAAVDRYSRRLSGPLLDRFDLFVNVPKVRVSKVFGEKSGESSSEVRVRVESAREVQRKRLAILGVFTNSELTSPQIRQTVSFTDKAERRLFASADRLKLGARAVVRVMKVARTIADLDGSEVTHENHVMEAVHFRDRKE